MRPLRVLLLGAPLGPRRRLNGAARAIEELALAMAERGDIEPSVCAHGDTPLPRGVGRVAVHGDALSRNADALLAAHHARFDLVHALFAPRVATGAALATIRLRKRPLVQTLASVPRQWATAPLSMVGDVVVATSKSTQRLAAQVLGRAVDRVVMPFLFEPPAHDDIAAAATRLGRESLLVVSDWEFGGGTEQAIAAFARASFPHGSRPRLVVAAREKSPESARAAASAKKRGVDVLGEVPSLLPYLAAAQAVVLAAPSTYAKLDHPRVLLEALALGTPVIVGSAPSLAELAGDGLGVVTDDEASLRDAMERAVRQELTVDRQAALDVLRPHAPREVAARYADIYRRLTT